MTNNMDKMKVVIIAIAYLVQSEMRCRFHLVETHLNIRIKAGLYGSKFRNWNMASLNFQLL